MKVSRLFYAATPLAVFVAVLCIVGFEIKQVQAACEAKCYQTWDKPPSAVSVNTGAGCQKAFSYHYKVTIGTNDDGACASSGFSFSAAVYSSPTSQNINTGHAITPTSFTIYNGGDTVQLSTLGELFDEDQNGQSSTYWIEDTTPYTTDSINVFLLKNSSKSSLTP